MSFNGSGSFIINSSGQPVVANTVISATVFNALTSDLATGLSTCITKDGQTTITANIPFGNNKITGLGSGTAATDAANLGQVQSTAAKLITVSGTDTITGTMSPALTAYAAGQLFYFIAAGANTTSVTLNVDGLGAKAVTRDGSTALAAGDIISGEMVVVCYDGTRFQMINAANSFGNATITGTLTLSGGTANGVAYLNGSKVVTSGSALVFDGSNLGIGTSSPASLLELRGSFGTATTAATISNSSASSASNIARLDFRLVNTFGGLERSAAIWGVNPNAAGNNGGALVFGVSANGTATTPSEVARFDQAGNLGIGTASPSYRLDVSATGTESGQFTTSGAINALYLADSGTTANTLYIGTVGNNFRIVTNSAERARIDSSGNLGIGTASPTRKLQVSGATATYASVVNTGVSPSALVIGADANQTTLYSWTTNAGATGVPLTFYTSASETMRLDTSGNLLVGATANPGVLNTSVVVDSGANSLAGLVLQNNTTGRTSTDGSHITIAGSTLRIVNLENSGIEFSTNNLTRASITGTGSVVAGNGALTTTATDGFLYVPTCAGTPTGVPTAITGMAPIVVNTTNNKLYFYSGGSWRDAGP